VVVGEDAGGDGDGVAVGVVEVKRPTTVIVLHLVVQEGAVCYGDVTACKVLHAEGATLVARCIAVKCAVGYGGGALIVAENRATALTCNVGLEGAARGCKRGVIPAVDCAAVIFARVAGECAVGYGERTISGDVESTTLPVGADVTCERGVADGDGGSVSVDGTAFTESGIVLKGAGVNC